MLTYRAGTREAEDRDGPRPSPPPLGCGSFTLSAGFSFTKLVHTGAPGRLSRLSVRLPVSAQVTVSRFHEFEPRIGLCSWQRGTCLGFSLPGSLGPSRTHTVSVSLRIN